MKTKKILLAVALASMAFAQVASAQVAIYISGAPATRKIWNEGLLSTIKSLTTASGSSTANIVQTWTTNSAGTSYDNANNIVLSGGAISGTAVTIFASWGGSTSGNQAVAATSSRSSPNAAYELGFIKASAIVSGTVATSSTNGNAQYPQFNLSDTFQSSLPFNGTTRVTSPSSSYDQLTEATTASPAITGFEFLANQNAPSRLNNITKDLAQTLFTNPNGTPLSLFTGLLSDTGTVVYPIGRDIGSGSRYAALAETGIGTANSVDLWQYEPASGAGLVGSGTAAVLTDIADNPSPGGTINQITFSEGNGGYSSTSAEESTLEASSSNAAVGYVIGYLTDSDAASVLAATAGSGQTALTWNGVPYSVSNIQNGSYTYWTYLHVYYNNTNNFIATTYPLAKKLADSLSTDLASDANTGAIFSSTLQVQRTGDGGIVTANFNY